DFADLTEGALEASATVGGRDANSLDITLDTTAPSVAVDPLTTNDTTPALSGTVDDPEATVTVTVDGSDVEATNNGDGTWRLADDTLSALPEGETTITVTATDAAGNETTATRSVTVDTIAPDAPTVDPTDGSELSGSAEPNSTVNIDTNGDGETDHSVTADGDGIWSVTPDTPLDDGTEISATATDEAGNTSDPTTVTVDGTAPAAPVIIEATDDVGDITDPLASGDSTDDTTPTLIGTAEAESTIEVFQDGVSVGTATADADGNWSFTPDALGDGEVTFTATATDAAGNTSDTSGGFTVTVDTIAPEAPTVDPTDGSELSGTAEAGSTVNIDTNGDGETDETVTADGDGNWSVTPDTPLADGTEVSATATDEAGNTSDPTTVTVDGTAPAAPVIVEATDDVGDITDPLASGDSTDDTTPTLIGTAEAESTIEVFQDGASVGTATADADGNWSFTPDALGDGEVTFTATATDAAGNTSDTSGGFTVTVDTIAPDAPTLALASDTGADGDGITSDGTVNVGGLEPDATWEYSTDGGSSWTAGSGSSFTVPEDDYAEGDVIARQTDEAGNISPAGGDLGALTVDTTAPDAPTLVLANDTGTDGDGITSDGTVNVGGLEADATWEYSTDGGDTWDAGSGSSFTVPEGDYAAGDVLARQTDEAGNTSDNGELGAVTVDTTAPENGDGTHSIAFDDGGDELLSDAEAGSVTLSGQVEATATVDGIVISDGTDSMTVADGDITVNGTGAVSVAAQNLTGLSDGELTVTMTVSDEAGNSGDVTDTTTLDTTAPENGDGTHSIAFDDGGDELLSDAEAGSVTLSGQVEDSATVDGIVISDGTDSMTVADGDITVDDTGAVSVVAQDLTGLSDGELTVTMTVSDEAGNSGDVTDTTTLDTTADADPVAALTSDDADGLINADEAGASSYTVSGLDAEATAEATFTDSNGDSVTVNVTANGSVTADLSTLADGEITSELAITDDAGNTATVTGDSVTLDTTAPTVTVDPLDTNDTTPALSGTVDDADATVTVTVDGTDYDAINNGDGTWTLADDVVAELADGDYTVTATATDLAGNAAIATGALVVDTTADNDGDGETVRVLGITEDDGVDNADFITSDTELVIDGSIDLDDGNDFSVDFNGTVYTEADTELTVNTDGAWNLDLTATTLAEGTYTAIATVTDSVGNTASDTKEITVQPNAAPVAAVNDGSLLGLIGAETLGLLDFNDQAFAAYDRDGNLESVVLEYDPALALLAQGWDVSERLASELGLDVEVVTNTTLGLLVTDSTLTITALDGGTIDNLSVNELLGSVYLGQDADLLSADLLTEVSITATDSQGLFGTAGAVDLLDATLLSADTVPVIEGTDDDDTGADAVEGTADGDRLYGYDGNDTLNGNGGNDLLRGGNGVDELNGGAGDDLMIWEGHQGDTFNGDAGEDTLLLTGEGIALDFIDDTAGDYVDPGSVNDIEHLSIGGSGANEASLDEASVLALTDADDELHIEGDQGDTLNLGGAWAQGDTVEVNGVAYTEYTLGDATLQVEENINVEAA
ncbi:Ig-like domain-containing protein, partial [Halomonas elongata]|uniref:Ig-like domain-containing protein n=1 Tax=Halomonas elongata TaxID=2746 RepID=UPI0023B18ACE